MSDIYIIAEQIMNQCGFDMLAGNCSAVEKGKDA